MTSQNLSEADRLKAEGNTLFAKNDFAEAYKKYTEALKHDDKNPILYSTRAACSLGLKRYVDASSDAEKATDINPGYARAWGRLAVAKAGLNRMDQAVDAWEHALGALPTENMSPIERKQKDQYSSELAAAKAKFEDEKANPKLWGEAMQLGAGDVDKLPWKRAMTMIPELTASRTWNSSAWVIERAYSDWEEGVDIMRKTHIKSVPGGKEEIVGRYGAIESLSSALVEDRRVFHIITADEDFLSMYNLQMEHESMIVNAWSKGGSRKVMEEAPKRLIAEGWDTLRSALSITIRGWMLRAFFEKELQESAETAVEFYNHALEVLKWGAERWDRLPNSPGVFQPTFVRGIKCLRLDALMDACKQNPSRFTHDDLLASADELLSELANAPTKPPVPDPAFFLSFFKYQIGEAHAVRGFCFLDKAQRSRRANGGHLTKDITKQYMEASMEYFKAARSYPPDDEMHAWYLHRSYHAQSDGGTTAGLLMKILDMLEESVPLMKKIWGLSVSGREGALEADLKKKESIQRALDNKQIELDSFVVDPHTLAAMVA